MDTNYHIFSDRNKNNKEKIIESTPTSVKYELPPVVFLKDEDRINEHPLVNKEYTDDDKRYMELMFSYFKEFMRLHKTNSLFKKSNSINKDRPHFSVTLDGNEKLRCILNNYPRALEMQKFCCVGFFGTRSLDNSKLPEIIQSDDALVSALPEFPKILAYVTIQRDIPESEEHLSHLPSRSMFNYGNIVIIEDFNVVNEWRNFTVHKDANQYLSPLYYHLVRIHNAQIAIPSSSFSQYLEDDSSKNQLIPEISFVRTKYYSFTPDGKVNFRGLREYKEIRFASFLSSNAQDFYSAVVESIAKKFNINAKFIDVYSEMEKDKHPNMSEKPHKLMAQYGIDFAFMCGLSYALGDHILEPLVSPVRTESIYQQQPQYYSFLVVRSDSGIDSLHSAKGKVFGYNEKESYSGYQILERHLLDNLLSKSIDNYFSKTIKTTSHLKSIEGVLNGQFDIASIDSTVYDAELLNGESRKQELLNNTKIIGILGPSTMPPLVAKKYSLFFNDYHKEIQSYLTSDEFKESLKPLLSNRNYLEFKKVLSENFNSFK
ncbi:hypothetical protein DICPUDRAFT_32613 [Dictyostelium purpureum]|uniref:Uncharacterized protein n=1 Tax=Dictyostelium purpureum TaxID=5786 RepID=F0ZJI4_DICPU|nr:uncharacterized protein DICPUDRAFT_32613 [Dictyostelium purpureum]EGC35926.1 hypothetical protein DICPUDRAFT_32613 [Dictyostelium purpureum]|eukprot:XP_003287580.1 hypothetical protein DICPUDRAFT_32613 [Dictyostelium purpureum]